MKKKCVICRKVFSIFPYQKDNAKYCSHHCYWQSLKGKPSKRRNGIIKKCLSCGKQIYVTPSLIKRRKFCSRICFIKEWNKKVPGWNKGKKCPQLSDEKNGNWKGDEVKNKGLHSWVKRKLNQQERCEFCKKKRKLHLSNKNHLYRRNLKDWQWLCVPCHKKYDLERIKNEKA